VKVHKGISAIVVVLIGLLGVAGCGGDSAISKAEYQQQLELICNKGQRERSELVEKLTKESERRNQTATEEEKEEAQTENIRSLMAVIEGTTEEIADVGHPKQDQKKAEELIQAREEAVERVEANPRSAIAEFEKIFERPTEIGEELEVPSCAV
jgi:hypothetical protein